MKKLLALLLALIIFSSSLLTLAACGDGTVDDGTTPGDGSTDGDGTEGGDGGTVNGDGENGEENKGEEKDESTAIVVPEYKDYQRDTVNFDELVYERPDISATIAVFEDLAKKVEENALPVNELIALITESEEPYVKLLSMSSLSHIYHSKDSSNEYWLGEYDYISTNYPAFSQAVEKLFVAAAQSPHKTTYEDEYFGFSLDDYVDGGDYTDECVKLMEEEASLENEYSALSTENVMITYEGKTDTYANIIAEYAEKYGETSQKYFTAKIRCDSLLEDAISKRSSELFIELLKIRAKIAEELGYESYEQYAYETIYHDYSPEKLDTFIEGVKNYVIPVYVTLSGTVFQPYISEYENTTNAKKDTDPGEMINSLYSLYSELDTELADVFAYMLQHKLYDIGEASTNRFEASFTTYIDSNNSPFLFLTLDNDRMDTLTAAHEFGHFYDMYTTYNATASLDFSEISSQALELLTLLELEESYKSKKSEYKYIYYLELDSIFSTIIFQSFYAACEIAVYELDYDEITKEAVDAAIAKTAASFSLSPAINDTKYIVIPHTMLYPFYVQSYATSMTVAAQIFCRERDENGSGFACYKELILNKEEYEFEEAISAAGLDSPLKEETLKKMADDIYYIILGAHYFKNSNGNVA